MDRGYVKLWRKVFDSQVFQDPELLKLFVLCLGLANHKENFVPIDGIKTPVKINKGSFLTGRYELHKSYYPKKKKNQKSPYTLWRWLKILENMEILSIKSCNKYSIITVTNWNQYQQHEQQMSNRRATDEQQMSTNKNVKECKECKEYKDPSLNFSWLDIELWNNFREHRKKLKAPMTHKAELIILNKLEKNRSNGDDPNIHIKKSIERGWKSVFPDKKEKQPSYSTTMRPI